MGLFLRAAAIEARVPSRRDRSSHRRAHRDDCVGGLSRDLRRRAARASAAPVPWSRAPRRRRPPFVRGVSPRLRRRRGAAEDRPPSDLDATPTPARVDGRPTRRVTHPARYRPSRRHPTDENDGRDPDRARDREFRATPPASASTSPSRLVDVRRRALRRDSNSPSTRFGRPLPPRTSSNPPTSPRSVSNPRPRAPRTASGRARGRRRRPPRARPRAGGVTTRSIRRTTESARSPLHGAARERREGRTRRPPARQSRPRRGRGHRALRTPRATRRRFARWRFARASSALRLAKGGRRCSVH